MLKKVPNAKVNDIDRTELNSMYEPKYGNNDKIRRASNLNLHCLLVWHDFEWRSHNQHVCMLLG